VRDSDAQLFEWLFPDGSVSESDTTGSGVYGSDLASSLYTTAKSEDGYANQGQNRRGLSNQDKKVRIIVNIQFYLYCSP
jgi:hypothetical protein